MTLLILLAQALGCTGGMHSSNSSSSIGAPAGPTTQTVNAIAVKFFPQGNYTSGSQVIASGSTLYFSAGCITGQKIANVAASTAGTNTSYTGSFTLTGADAGNFTITGSNPATLQCLNTVTAGTYNFNIVAGANSYTRALTAYAGHTYYISPTGSDANAGSSAGSAWLSPNHSVHCGDFLLMSPGAYSSNNLGSGTNFGAVTCPGQDNVAWLKCSTFAGCTVNGGFNSVALTANYWGVQGLVVQNASNSCIKSGPFNGTGATVAHLAVANNVITGCAGSGIQFGAWAGVGNGNDYWAIMGNLVYGNSAANGPCFSGISAAGDSNFDTVSGTHRYLAYNVAWHNINGPNCNGASNTTDGEGFIFDRPDVNDVTGTLVAENNLFTGNGGRGFQVFALNANPGGSVKVIFRHNTSTYNQQDPLQSVYTDGDVLYQCESTHTYCQIQDSGNLVAQYARTVGDQGNTNNAFAVQESDLTTSSIIDADFIYGVGSPHQNILNWDSGYSCLSGSAVPSPGSGSNNQMACAGMLTSTDPVFAGMSYFSGSIAATTLSTSSLLGSALSIGMQLTSNSNPVVTGLTKIVGGAGSSWTVDTSQNIGPVSMFGLPVSVAPSCSGATDALACSASLISGFKPTVSSAVSYGAVNSQGQLGNFTGCDANNATPFIQNVERALPADMNPCG
jgi:hypothetical protein